MSADAHSNDTCRTFFNDTWLILVCFCDNQAGLVEVLDKIMGLCFPEGKPDLAAQEIEVAPASLLDLVKAQDHKSPARHANRRGTADTRRSRMATAV